MHRLESYYESFLASSLNRKYPSCFTVLQNALHCKELFDSMITIMSNDIQGLSKKGFFSRKFLHQNGMMDQSIELPIFTDQDVRPLTFEVIEEVVDHLLKRLQIIKDKGLREIEAKIDERDEEELFQIHSEIVADKQRDQESAIQQPVLLAI